jgi:Vault protein inter-alpha-trypsin domain
MYYAGIVPAGSSLRRDEYPLVQSRCHYEILDVYTIANVVQDYHSKSQLSRDVEYVFPLPPGAAVCSFKAVIDDTKVIQGVLKEKEDAKREFKEAVAQGKTAGLLQQEHADGETVLITIVL